MYVRIFNQIRNVIEMSLGFRLFISRFSQRTLHST